MIEKKNFKFCFEIGAGVIILISVLWGYLPEPEKINEFTCISNSAASISLFVSGVLTAFFDKKLNHMIYGTILVALMFVFLVCLISLFGQYNMNFRGAYFFLHVLNPFLLLLYYLMFVEENKSANRYDVFVMPAFAMLYLVYDYVQGIIDGSFVYGFLEPSEMTFMYTLLAFIISYTALLFLSILIKLINRTIHFKFNSKQ